MPRRIWTFADGMTPAAVGLDAAFWNQLLLATLGRVATETSWPQWPGDGGIYRYAVIPNLERDPGSPTPSDPGTDYLWKVIDSEVDWRDRLLLVHAQATDATLGGSWQGPIVPGITTDRFFTRMQLTEQSVIGYTRTGAAVGAPGGNHIALSSYVSIFARSTDGALIVQRAPDDTNLDPISLWFLLDATEPTGQRSSPTAYLDLLATDDTPIYPYQLNGHQDRSMLGQVRESAGVPIDAYPLGPKGSGDHGGATVNGRLYIPENRTKWGAKDRQPVAGGRFRYFSAAIADASVAVLDSETDWRDRLVRAIGRWSSSLAIQPGEADDALHQDSGTEAYNVGRYTGAGQAANAISDDGYHLLVTGSSFPGISIFARSSDGALVVGNDTGGAITMTGMVWATPQWGIRS